MWKCPQLLCHDLLDVVYSSKMTTFEWVILLSGGSFSIRLAHSISLYPAGLTTVQYGCSSDSSILVVLCYDENEMGGACSAYGEEDRRMGGFGGET